LRRSRVASRRTSHTTFTQPIIHLAFRSINERLHIATTVILDRLPDRDLGTLRLLRCSCYSCSANSASTTVGRISHGARSRRWSMRRRRSVGRSATRSSARAARWVTGVSQHLGSLVADSAHIPPGNVDPMISLPLYTNSLLNRLSRNHEQNIQRIQPELSHQAKFAPWPGMALLPSARSRRFFHEAADAAEQFPTANVDRPCSAHFECNDEKEQRDGRHDLNN